jgi:hypothetical protein
MEPLQLSSPRFKPTEKTQKWLSLYAVPLRIWELLLLQKYSLPPERILPYCQHCELILMTRMLVLLGPGVY